MRGPPRALLAWLPALLVAAVWLPSLSASFQFDDWNVVLGDPRVASLAAWWDSMPGMRALLKLSYALNHEAGGQVEGFRAVNVLLHAANAALVFLFTCALAHRLHPADERGAIVVATVTALVFALHPVQSESVTYISGRSNVLVTLFVLLSLLAWLHAREPGRRGAWYFASALAFVAALATKELAVMLPLAMLLVLVADKHTGRRQVGFPLALLALSVVLLVVLWSRLPYGWLLETSLATRSPIGNLIAQTQGLGWLAAQLVRWDRLNADPMLHPVTVFTPGMLLPGTVWVAALVAGLVALRRRPWLGVGILWFLLWLAPTNSLLARLDVANERQLYLAILGPAWLLGHGMARLKRRAWFVVLPLAVLLAVGTGYRNRVYTTEIHFWQDVTAKAPHNARAWNNLGMAHAVACDADAAAEAFSEAMRRAPEDPRAEINLALLMRGELPDVPPQCRSAFD